MLYVLSGSVVFPVFWELVLLFLEQPANKKIQNKTYYYGDNFRRTQEYEDITVIDAEIIKDSLLKPYIADVKSANKTNKEGKTESGFGSL